MRIFFNILLILVLLIFFLSLYAPYVPPAKSELIYFLGLGFPVITFFVFFIAIYELFIGKKYEYIILLIPVLYSGYLFFNLHMVNIKIEPKADDMDIMTYNIYNERTLNKDVQTKSDWTEYIAAKEATLDIILFQELNHLPELPSSFDKFNIYHPEGTALVTMSKYPILDQGVLKYDKYDEHCIWIDILFQKDTLRVYNFHLRSNWISGILDLNLDKEKAILFQWLEYASKIQKNIYSNSVIRQHQADVIAAHVANCPYEHLLGGDMNELVQSYAYQRIKGDNADSFYGGKIGLQPTYNGKLKGLRIDYVFIPKSYKVIEHKVDRVHYSDHYPVRVSLQK